MGPSFTEEICPQMAPLGTFRNNVAHSTMGHGVRIDIWFPSKNGYDCPENPEVETANLINTTVWKTGATGLWIEFLSHFYVENLLGKLQLETTGTVKRKCSQILF